MKSLLSLGPDAPHVHLRLRKRLSRCTLDCGFKTAESPALRGFVAGAAGACDCGPLSCTKIERLSSLRKPPCKVRFFVQNRSRKYRPKVTVTTLFQTVSHPDFQLLAQTPHVRFHEQKWVHTRLCQQDRTQGLTRRNTGRFGWGRYHYPRSIPRVSETLRGRGLKRQTLPLLGLGREVLSKNAESLRNSDAHKRIAVPKAFYVLLEYIRPRPKSGKVRRSDTRPGDFRERAVRVEGSDSGPVRKAPVSACKPVCAILLRKPSVYPRSLVKANVGRLCRRC